MEWAEVREKLRTLVVVAAALFLVPASLGSGIIFVVWLSNKLL